MNRTAIATTITLGVLAGCSSTQPVYRTQVAANNTGDHEGVGDALGSAIFGKSVYLAKHSDSNIQYASEQIEATELLASVPDEQD